MPTAPAPAHLQELQAALVLLQGHPSQRASALKALIQRSHHLCSRKWGGAGVWSAQPHTHTPGMAALAGQEWMPQLLELQA